MASAQLRELILLGFITFYLVISLIILSYITVGLRLWVRYRITKSPGWDDAAMVATLLLFTCYCSFILVITFRSQQRKLFNIEDIHVTLIYVQLSEIFYILTTTLLKVSLGLFFLRILTKRWQTLIFHVVLGISATYGLFYVFVTIFQCGDPAKLADSLLGSKACLPSAFLLTTGYMYGVINVIADWTFVLIPISVLIDSDLDRRAKISVSVVMGFGAIGSVSSILRMVYLKGILFGGGGLTATSIKATIFATAEPGTGIIAASIAILRPLIRKVSSDIHTRVSEYGSRKGSYRTTGSLLKISNPIQLDTIALTSESGKKASMYSIRSDDAWSPTVVSLSLMQNLIMKLLYVYKLSSIRQYIVAAESATVVHGQIKNRHSSQDCEPEEPPMEDKDFMIWASKEIKGYAPSEAKRLITSAITLEDLTRRIRKVTGANLVSQRYLEDYLGGAGLRHASCEVRRQRIARADTPLVPGGPTADAGLR
ncbi:hypothetical protein N0V83_003470 [Neocucurbitaria cava]|uniref:Rhodopsin domain-containing protein n=1 Tax=Neocucurbitaria cava TaxID=798079 RepID=A0A9W8YE40_9PLEO|nr:hypothetical protein N0V83_003470 [Neocucurbitaria cava]